MYYFHCKLAPFTKRVQHIEAAPKMNSWIVDPKKMKRWSAKEQGDGDKELGVQCLLESCCLNAMFMKGNVLIFL